MVTEDTVNAALQFIRSTAPLNRCGVQDVLGGDDYADIKLGFPTPDGDGGFTLFEACKETAKHHESPVFQLIPKETHHTDEEGVPYFFIRVESASTELNR